MGKTIPMQPWVTIRGVSATKFNIVQPAPGWVDGQSAEEVCLAIELAANTVSAGATYCALVIQTASSPEGPWTSLLTLTDAGYTRLTKYFSAKSTATDRFQRFVRWQLTPPSDLSGNWTMTYRICATVR